MINTGKEMNDSELNGDTLAFVTGELGYSSSYEAPEVYAVTSRAVLYRVRKAGKFFIIKTAKDGAPQSLDLIKREYELSVGRSHPHIVDVFTYEPSTIVGAGIVMEYIDGRTLKEFLAEKPSLSLRRRVFLQLLQAVAYLHRSGVVHNDIKPENIMITRADNDVKLLDFGIADSDAHFLVRTPGCTPLYASPELRRQEKNLDSRSDIYSLGVVMKEVFGGWHYGRIHARCLCHKKEKRYSDADALMRAVKHYNYPFYAVIAFALLLLLLQPLFMYVRVGNELAVAKQLINLQQTEIDRARNALVAEKEYSDSLQNVIKERVVNVYTQMRDSLKALPPLSQEQLASVSVEFDAKSSCVDMWSRGEISPEHRTVLVDYNVFVRNEYRNKLFEEINYVKVP